MDVNEFVKRNFFVPTDVKTEKSKSTINNLITICLEKELVLAAFNTAMNNNILIFDSDSDNFSVRLISLIKTVSKRENYGNVRGIYLSIPEKIKINNEEILISDGCYILGIPVIVCDTLCFTQEFNKSGGSFAIGKTEVCLVICDNSYLLGCY